MLRQDHEALLHGAIDNTLTLAERDALGELLATDADARQRFAELERLNALLASLGQAEAPSDLVANVLARISPHTAAPQPVRNIVRLVPKRGVIVNKKLIFGLAAAAVVILAVITYTSYPPATEGTEATIGAAQRAQTPQIASKDVGLGDTSAQDVLQTETWDAIMKDQELRNLLQDAELRQYLLDADLRLALRNDAVVRALRDRDLSRNLMDQALMRSLNDRDLIARLENTNLKAALQNEAFLRALRNDNLRAYLARPGVAMALSRDAMQRALADRNFDAALMSRQFARELASYDIKK